MYAGVKTAGESYDSDLSHSSCPQQYPQGLQMVLLRSKVVAKQADSHHISGFSFTHPTYICFTLSPGS